jgi:hypothetical protein
MASRQLAAPDATSNAAQHLARIAHKRTVLTLPGRRCDRKDHDEPAVDKRLNPSATDQEIERGRTRQYNGQVGNARNPRDESVPTRRIVDEDEVEMGGSSTPDQPLDLVRAAALDRDRVILPHRALCRRRALRIDIEDQHTMA